MARQMYKALFLCHGISGIETETVGVVQSQFSQLATGLCRRYICRVANPFQFEPQAELLEGKAYQSLTQQLVIYVATSLGLECPE